MSANLTGLKIAVLGGDDRELVLIPELMKLGALVSVAGFPPRPELANARLIETVEAAIHGVDAIILPMPGIDASGNIRAVYATRKLALTEEIVRQIPADTPIIIGVARPILREWANKYRLHLIEIAEMDEVAILNSVPSAEGAIQIAMEELPITIHSSQAFVLGFGRTGKTLARMLQGIGAHTTVVARKKADLARIWEMGFRGLTFTELTQYIQEAEIIFNTVPAMVLDEEILRKVNREALIVDLASTPGGTDFLAAERLGIKAILAPGLPGKVAPKTAGLILARVIPPLIVREVARAQKRLLFS
ncbi:MAG: dipicolinate synthase subunit DpsA [Firmicutes bacterium]|nr:dipicolinate synthase subunit DpsA [Bacillota bacterium]